MPRQSEAMKDVGACEKRRGGGNRPVIRRCPNGETHPVQAGYHYGESIAVVRRTRGTETSKYPEEQKSTEIPLVAASERG